MNRLPAWLLVLLVLLALPAVAAPAVLTTESERSGFLRTGRYDEVVKLCTEFARTYPQAVRCVRFGITPEGRPMHALVVTRSGARTPEQARARKLPVVLMQGGIHAGEIDGKDAGFQALRQVLDGQVAAGALDKLVWVFVPVFNVDGHERFGAWNRPNQRGPEQMGWRTTAQNFNLNRDYAKADAPEMQAMLALVEQWDPLLTVDLHVTDGARFQHDVSVQVEPVHAGDDALRGAGAQLRDGVLADLSAQGSQPLPFYPSFTVPDDPASGFEDSVSPPRFSTGYFLLRNRFGMLVETHSWRTYPERVRITRNTIVSVLERVAAHGPAWRQVAHDADARARALGGQDVPLAWRASDTVRTIDFQGYAYTRTPSEVSGALMTRYDETRPQVWKVPLRDNLVPSIGARAPLGGYVVPAAWRAMVEPRLRAHGLEFRMLPATQVDAQQFKADDIRFAGASVESHQRLTIAGHWTPLAQSLAPGSLFVPIAQPRARLVMALLEPMAPDSLLQWGEFNNAFERKEYMEDYVAEEVARQMLAADPALKAAFDKRLREDAAFAADPQARLTFFHRLHPSWDDRYGVYPVLRVDTLPH